MKLQLYNPTLTIIDGKGVITGYPESMPVIKEGEYKMPFAKKIKKWRESKISYPVEESVIDFVKKTKYVSNVGTIHPNWYNDKIIGIELTEFIINKLELIDTCNVEQCFSEMCRPVVRLIPQQIKSEETQEDNPMDFISPIRLKRFDFKHVDQSPFENLNLKYYVRDSVLLFYNDSDISTFLIGFGEMRHGKYHGVTFRWINTMKQLNEIYKAIVGKELTRK